MLEKNILLYHILPGKATRPLPFTTPAVIQMTSVMAAVVGSEQRLGRDGKHRLYLRQQGRRYAGAHVNHRLSPVVRVHPAARIVIVRLAAGTVKLRPQLFVVVCDAGSGGALGIYPFRKRVRQQGAVDHPKHTAIKRCCLDGSPLLSVGGGSIRDSASTRSPSSPSTAGFWPA